MTNRPTDTPAGTPPNSHAETDAGPGGFYVGDQPLPAADRRTLKPLVPLLLWGFCCVAAGAALLAGPGGDGAWLTDDSQTHRGVLVADPYPALVLTDQHGSTARLFLTEPGKTGPRDGLAELAGQHAELTGFLMTRDGRRVLEMIPGDQGLTILDRDAPATNHSTPQPVGDVELAGEIVDFKCYLGAMKPGSGRTHRACAILCVAGGVPPALVVPTGDGDGDGPPAAFILTDPDGGPLNGALLPHIGLPVTVAGRASLVDGELYLATSPDQITRR